MVVCRLLRLLWFGWEPTDEPFVPLIVALEPGMGRPEMTAILLSIARGIGGDSAAELVREHVKIVGAPEFTGTLYGDDPASERWLIRAARDHGARS